MNNSHWASLGTQCSLILGAMLLTSCQPAPAPTGTGAATRKAIKPGSYQVCQDDGQSGHGSYVGEHLKEGDQVEIGSIKKPATKVCLKGKCPTPGNPQPGVKTVWMSGDENQLEGQAVFDHVTSSGSASVVHFVRIFDNPADHGEKAGQCTLNEILTVQFCTENELSGEMTCAGPPPHLGHIHIQK